MHDNLTRNWQHMAFIAEWIETWQHERHYHVLNGADEWQTLDY